MTSSHLWQATAASRIEDLAGDERVMENRLSKFRAFSNAAVICGIAVPILAGSTVLTSSQTSLTTWPLVCGWLTLATSLLVALHKGLDCDAVHARIYAALAELRTLIMRYEALLRAPAHATTGAAGGEPPTFETLEADLADFYSRNIRTLPARPTRVTLPGRA